MRLPSHREANICTMLCAALSLETHIQEHFGLYGASAAATAAPPAAPPWVNLSRQLYDVALHRALELTIGAQLVEEWTDDYLEAALPQATAAAMPNAPPQSKLAFIALVVLHVLTWIDGQPGSPDPRVATLATQLLHDLRATPLRGLATPEDQRRAFEYAAPLAERAFGEWRQRCLANLDHR